MEIIKKLGDEIEEKWRRENYRDEVFPKFAAECLAKFEVSKVTSTTDILEWTLRQTELPSQKDLSAKFGEPPITLYAAPRFYIDVYFWFHGTTQIHQHAFCGAFQVLAGSSIHSWYQFEREHSVNSYFEIGELHLHSCELLSVGDIQTIEAGRAYIHSLFHLDHPSATLVVRTNEVVTALPQFSYHRPSFAIDPFFQTSTTTKKLQTVTALLRSGNPQADRLITDLLNVSDFQTCYEILNIIYSNASENTLARIFELESKHNRFDAFIASVAKRFPLEAEHLTNVFAFKDSATEITRKRNYVTDPNHRFFLAILMNVDDRKSTLKLINQRFPESDPIDKALDWIYELSTTKVAGMNIPNALGLADFGAIDLALLEGLMRGKADGEIVDEILSEGVEQSQQVKEKAEEKLQRLRQAPVFRALLR